MPFAEALKMEIRRRADMRCCVCHAIGVEVHHIVPAAEGGADSEDNAAPLCPSCHETYGANPTKRKFVREARDNWFDICGHHASGGPQLEHLINLMNEGATKTDLANLKRELLESLKEPSAPSSLPLGQVLAFLYDFEVDADRVTEQEVQFFFEFLWGGPTGVEETDQIKVTFLNTFGTASCLRLARYALSQSPIKLTKWFTERELDQVVHFTVVAMILLLHHADLAPADFVMDLRIDGKSLSARLRQAGKPTTSTDGDLKAE